MTRNDTTTYRVTFEHIDPRTRDARWFREGRDVFQLTTDTPAEALHKAAAILANVKRVDTGISGRSAARNLTRAVVSQWDEAANVSVATALEIRGCFLCGETAWGRHTDSCEPITPYTR